jgi:hypothetical protein
MKRNIALSAVLIIVLFNLVHSNCHAQSNMQEAKKAIAASNAIYFQSFAKNDSSIFVDRYAELSDNAAKRPSYERA